MAASTNGLFEKGKELLKDGFSITEVMAYIYGLYNLLGKKEASNVSPDGPLVANENGEGVVDETLACNALYDVAPIYMEDLITRGKFKKSEKKEAFEKSLSEIDVLIRNILDVDTPDKEARKTMLFQMFSLRQEVMERIVQLKNSKGETYDHLIKELINETGIKTVNLWLRMDEETRKKFFAEIPTDASRRAEVLGLHEQKVEQVIQSVIAFRKDVLGSKVGNTDDGNAKKKNAALSFISKNAEYVILTALIVIILFTDGVFK